MEIITEYAKFNYYKEDQELVSILVDYLNKNAKKVFDFFGSDLEKKPLEINIIPTK